MGVCKLGSHAYPFAPDDNERRIAELQGMNSSMTAEFVRELMQNRPAENELRSPVDRRSKFKVIVSGPVIEVYEYQEGVRHGKQGKPSSRGDPERIRTEDGKTIDPETGEIVYDRMAARMATMRLSKNTFRRVILMNFDAGSTFVTLTFRDGSVSDVTNVQKCNVAFDHFIKRMRRKYGSFKYARVIEFQDANGRGAVHYHLIFDGLPYIPYDQLADIWGNGFVGINRIDHVDNVGAYIRKYMAQDMEDKRLMGLKAYATSHGLKRPYEAYGVEAAELIDAYELCNKKIVFANQYDSEHQGRTIYREYNLQREEGQT